MRVQRTLRRRPVWLGWVALLGVVVGLTLVFDRVGAHASPALVPQVVERPTSRAPAAHPERAHAQTVILLVIDGIRPQEVFSGVDPKLARKHSIDGPPEPASELVPNLHRLATQAGAAVGVPGLGPALRASGPVYRSLPGYLELLSGRPAKYCLSNRCGSARYPTLLDRVGDGKLGSAALFGSWPHLIHAAALEPEHALISAGRAGGTNLELLYRSPTRAALRDRANVAGPGPSKGDFRADAFTSALALDYLEHEQPRFLFVSIGEADAWGHANNYRAHLKALHQSDAFVGELFAATEQLNRSGHRTTLLVTTDHGRDAQAREHGPQSPESGRVWAIAAGFAVERRGHIPLEQAKTLSVIAPSVLRLLGVEAEPNALPELFSP